MKSSDCTELNSWTEHCALFFAEKSNLQFNIMDRDNFVFCTVVSKMSVMFRFRSRNLSVHEPLIKP